MNNFIIITGQTATGKTKLALKYAQKYNGELINCDSRQIYKYLDIITGKDKVLLKKYKIWLYDVVNPNEYFSSFDYTKIAFPIIKKILAEGKTPIIVGGTYFYISHLLYGVDSEKIPPDFKLRKKLGTKSVLELQKIISDLSPSYFNNLNNSEKNNPQRLIRKIEIEMYRRDVINHVSTKKQSFLVETRHALSLQAKLNLASVNFELIGLKFKSKESLRQAVEQRVEQRLKQGAVDEVKKVLKLGYKETDPGLKTIGYQQLILYLKGVIDLDTAIQLWITKEFQYAKRQYTFMKTDKNIQWKEI